MRKPGDPAGQGQGELPDSRQRFRAGLGVSVRRFGIQIAIFGIASLFLLPSSWRFLSQGEPVTIGDPQSLVSLADDAWVRGSITVDPVEATRVKSRKRGFKLWLPVQGSGRAVFFEHRGDDPVVASSPLAFDGRISHLPGWLNGRQTDELRQSFQARGVELPQQLVLLKPQPPPSLGMFFWRAFFHLAGLFGIGFVLYRLRRGLRWREDAQMMMKAHGGKS